MQAFIRILFAAFAQAITGFLYVLMVLVAYVNIKVHAQLEYQWLGDSKETLRNRIMELMLLGMLVGLLASLIIVGLGIVVDAACLMIIWPLTLLFSLVLKEQMSFAYAGTIAGLSSLLFGWPKADLAAILALVGLMHLIEGLLITINAKKAIVPVVIKDKEDNPAAAFVLDRTWPIPLVLLIIPLVELPLSAEGISMPSWWPIFDSTSGFETMTMLPLAFIIRFRDIVVAEKADRASQRSGLKVLLYGLLVIVLAYISKLYDPLRYPVLIMVPLSYHLLRIQSKRKKARQDPIYQAPWRGLRVLAIQADRPGQQMGIMTGDILLNINGRPVNSPQMLAEALKKNPTYIWVDIDREGQRLSLEHRDYQNDIEDLGLVFVPRRTGRYYKGYLKQANAFSLKGLLRKESKHL